MSSEIRANKQTNRAGLGTVTYADTGIIVSGIVTCTELSGLTALNIAGVGTASTLDINGDIDVDGHTNLDNVSIAGVVTATSFVGSGANLTSLPAQATIANNADNRVITGGSGVNLNGEANMTFDGSLLKIASRAVIGNGSEYQIPSRSNTSSYTPQFQITGAWNNPTHGATMALNGRNDYPFIWLNSGATYQDNSGCGVIAWSIKDGAGNYCNTAEIRSFVDGTPGNNDSPGDLSFRTTPAGTCQSTEKLRIASNGLITATQSNSTIGLIVKNSAHDSQLQILATASNKNSVIFFGDAGDDDIGQIDYDHNDNSLSFTVNTLERLRINSSGFIGMGGNTNPTNVLHIKTAVTNTAVATIESTATNSYPFLRLKNDAREYQLTCHGGLSDAFTIYDGTSSAHRFTITSGGQVRLPNNGQELTWGASQQMKFYYESSEERMYLQGDGAYGFAFRINSGNRIEIDKTTGDVTMQGASGRNFQWDNSEASLYLTDNGSGSSGRLKIGSGGDLQMYHDVSGNLNHITAATNGTIKISGDAQFFDYTGVTKRMVIDSNGLRVGTVSAPTLPTTGVTPMIMRNATNFTKEVHRTISDYRSISDGTYAGYLLLVPAWPGSNTTAKKFYGTVIYDRGGTGSGNSTNVSTVHASVAYNEDQFYVENARTSQYATLPAKVTYNGTAYLALKFGSGGGGPHNGIHIDGLHIGTDSNFLRLVRDNEVDSVQNASHGAIANNNATQPICGVMVVDMDGTPLNDDSIRYMRGGTIHFEYSPAQTDCYDNGIFTARVNGIYHVTAGVLTGNNVGRVEFGIQRQVTGGSYQNVVNFNGAGDFSNSHNGPTATAFIKMKAGWNLRVYRVSSNQGAYASTHANNYFGAVLMHGLMDSQV